MTSQYCQVIGSVECTAGTIGSRPAPSGYFTAKPATTPQPTSDEIKRKIELAEESVKVAAQHGQPRPQQHRKFFASDEQHIEISHSYGYYSALLDVAIPQCAEKARLGEYYMCSEGTSCLPRLATSILNYEYARERAKGNFRLNATIPAGPEYSVDEPQASKPQKPAVGAEDGERKPSGDNRKQLTAAEKKAIIVERVSSRISKTNDPQLGFLAWSGMSCATVPWKMCVFDNLFPSGKICFAGGTLLERDAVLGLVLARAFKWARIDANAVLSFISDFSSGNISRLSCPHAEAEDGFAFWQAQELSDPKSAAHSRYTTWLSKFALVGTDHENAAE